jgi:hypothetical protein
LMIRHIIAYVRYTIAISPFGSIVQLFADLLRKIIVPYYI